MNWETRRKFFYITGIVLFFIAVSVYGLRNILFPAPTCHDKKQNGFETGIDCGGTCTLKCSSDVTPIKVIWSRAIQISSSSYDLATFISNRNQDSAPSSLAVDFTVYDNLGAVAYEKKINTIPPSGGDIPVILENVNLPKEPKNVSVSLTEGPYFRISPNFQASQISTITTRFENGTPARVYATLRNLTRNTFSRFPVRVVLYDATETAIGVGETYVDGLGKEKDVNVIFTWPNSFKEAPTVIRVYPILDALQ